VTDADGGGSLAVQQELECCYIEGSRSHLRLRTGGGRVVAEEQFGPASPTGPVLAVTALPADTYVLESWQQPCEAACPPQGGLDPATDRCDLTFELASGEELEALVEVTPGEGCTIVVGDDVPRVIGDGAVHALAAATGERRWTTTIGGSMVELVAVGAGRAYVTSTGQGGDALQAVDLATGDVVWRHETAGWWPPGGAMVADDTLYATAWDGTTVALDTTSGDERWRAATPGEGPKAPAVVDDVVVVGTDTRGNLYGLDRDTGETRWQRRLPGNITDAPTAGAGAVHVTVSGGEDGAGRLVAVDAATGATAWEAPLPGSVVGGATTGADTVVAASGSIGTGTGTLRAVEAATGTPRWSATTDGLVFGAPTLADDLVLVADVMDDGSANLYAFAADDGAPAWTTALPGELRGTPLVLGDRVHLTAHPAHLLELDLTDGTTVRRVDAGDLPGDVDELTAPRTDGDVVVVGSS
jgi:outer membrane protein assembly factor BamB